MRLLYVVIIIFICPSLIAQTPCGSNPVYRQFDFWIGEWEVYGKNGNKAGDSKISLILDSCIVLEEWTSASKVQGLTYTGKSFNTWNRASRQWQQTWVDNTGGTTEYLKGKFADNKMQFLTEPFYFKKDSLAVRKLTFYNLSVDKVRQHGEISKDNGATWTTEYDLEYRRTK